MMVYLVLSRPLKRILTSTTGPRTEGIGQGGVFLAESCAECRLVLRYLEVVSGVLWWLSGVGWGVDEPSMWVRVERVGMVVQPGVIHFGHHGPALLAFE